MFSDHNDQTFELYKRLNGIVIQVIPHQTGIPSLDQKSTEKKIFHNSINQCYSKNSIISYFILYFCRVTSMDYFS